MSEKLTRRAVLAAGSAGVVGSGLVGSVAASHELDVVIIFPNGALSRYEEAKDALESLDGDVTFSLDVSGHSSDVFDDFDYDDREETLTTLEDYLDDKNWGSLGGDTLFVVLYSHSGVLAQLAGDEMSGAGFNAWILGAASDADVDHFGHTIYVDGSRERKYENDGGNYAFAFVNYGMRSGTAKFYINRAGYSSTSVFKNTVIHEAAHCFGASHSDGAIRRNGDVTPMFTWYGDDIPFSNSEPSDNCYKLDDPDDHTQTTSTCTRGQLNDHYWEYF